jgi:hypothetical protein
VRAIYNREAVLHRFNERTDQSLPHWGWGGATDKSGYGRIYVGPHWSSAPAFVVSLMLFKPEIEIPNGYQPDHTCKYTTCVDPNHLEVVTALINNSRAHRKIDEEMVLKIYKLVQTKTAKEVSTITGVSVATIYSIKSGQRWGWLTGHNV